MAAFDGQIRFSMGGANFQLRDWGMDRRAVYDQSGRRVGIDWRIRGTGWVEGTDANDFAAKLVAVRNAFVSGQDFRVWGLGQVMEFELPAARCLRGGPPSISSRLTRRGPAPR